MAPVPYSLKGKRVWVAGHTGMVGQALVRRLIAEDCTLLTAPRKELDLVNQAAVDAWVKSNRPEAIFIAAARVGGIVANNTLRASFLYDNLMIAANIIHAAHVHGVEKLMLLGSTCIYPRLSPQPMHEDMLLTGALEPTNEPYAVAKIAGIKMCETYRAQYGSDFNSVMPTNLYGPGDNYHPEHSHAMAALIRRFHEAKELGSSEVVVWGTGTPRREFLYVDDMADATVYVMKTYSGAGSINIGVGADMTIAELATTIAKVAGYTGRVVYDKSRPDGMPRKLVDVSRLTALGWKPRVALVDGIKLAYQDFLKGNFAER